MLIWRRDWVLDDGLRERLKHCFPSVDQSLSETGRPASRSRQYRLYSTSVLDSISAGLGGGGIEGGVAVLRHFGGMGLTARIEGAKETQPSQKKSKLELGRNQNWN